MSGARGRPEPLRGDASRRGTPRALLPLLDRLIDDAPEKASDPPMSSTEALAMIRRSVRRDIEALLNAQLRWRSWSPELKELAKSPLGFGIADCAGGMFHDQRQREVIRAEVEDAIRRFEPRFQTVRVILVENATKLDSTLRLRIEALLHAEPAPEPVTFDTIMDAAMANVVVRAQDDV